MSNYEKYKTFDAAKREHERLFGNVYPYKVQCCCGDAAGIWGHFSNWLFEEAARPRVSCIKWQGCVFDIDDFCNNCEIERGRVKTFNLRDKFGGYYNVCEVGGNRVEQGKWICYDSSTRNLTISDYEMFDDERDTEHSEYLYLKERFKDADRYLELKEKFEGKE